MAEQLGIAVIGCGYWGVNYVRVFNELPETRVVAVCDQRLDRCDELAKRFPDLHLTTQVDAALQHDGVDAVVVCTNAATHYDVTQRALMVGKHVLVEKPLTTISTDAEELIDLASSMSRVLMVGHTFVYNQGIRKVKEYINAERRSSPANPTPASTCAPDRRSTSRRKARGDGAAMVRRARDQVYYLYATRTNLGPIRSDCSALWDLAAHDIAIFNFLLDRTPRWVSAVGAKVLQNCREDVGFITLGYQGRRDDIVGHIHVSWADPHKTREVVVVGSDRRIVFNDLNGLEQVRIFEKGVKPIAPEPVSYGEYHFQIRDGDILSPRIEVSEPLKNQCRHFVDCVVRGTKPLTDGRAGEEVVRVLEAVEASLQLKGAPVEVGANRKYEEFEGRPVTVRAKGKYEEWKRTA